jgi:hypothetical protein
VSFRQACMNDFRVTVTVVGFTFLEDDHGWTTAWQHFRFAGTWARSL